MSSSSSCANPDKVDVIRRHLSDIHADYVLAFEALLARSQAQEERER